uniref:Kinesin-like protein n=1 Tax=Graphocephala atropunctata TaxID=36148 RepID=A0A1B6MHE8_9HEMI
MTDKTPIPIYCRVKPYTGDSLQEILDYEINQGSDKDTLIITSQQNSMTVNHKPDSYNFHALRGFNGTIFAYGQTGSGKTFTISGEKDNQGIVPRALQDIFSAVAAVDNENVEIQMSYLEIYNEHSNDLLMPITSEKKKISLRESNDKMMEWHNLSVYPVETFSEAMELLALGDNHRIVCDTPMNLFSSRSHTILTIYLKARLQDSMEVRKAKLNLVDLAGSERVHKTGEEGIVLEEARHINLSLHYLEQVIVALSDSSRTHVPYRNCTMTSALRDSLGGNCMTVMVANIAINKANLEETVSTCRFAQRVALVRNELLVNTEKDLSGENNQLREEIRQLRGQCSSLQAKVRELEQRDACEEWLSSIKSGEAMKLCEKIKPTSSHTGGLNVQQLQTDIIYLVEWLQDELKQKNVGLPALSSDTFLSSSSAVEPDEGFEHFVATVEAEDDWTRAKEMERDTADALNVKVETINSVHQEILNWWKNHEKTLVKEMLSGRALNILRSESFTDLSVVDCDSSVNSLSVDNLLARHSDLLKDFQLLKSRLQSSKRSLQRIKRKYMVEYNNWKKSEKPSSEFLFEKLEILDDNDDNLCMLTRLEENIVLKNNNHITKVIEEEKSRSNLNYEESISNYNNIPNNTLRNTMSHLNFLSSDSDLNSTLGDIDDSVFSTSTLVSDIRDGQSKPVYPRLVHSVPNLLDATATQYRSRYTLTKQRDLPCQWGQPLSKGDCLSPNAPPFPLTGDQDIDDEIIAFYQNRHITY